MIDIHCHLLPGIDDGPKSWDQSLNLCRAMADEGIERAVATPHLIDGVYENVRSRVEPLTAELRQRLADAGIDLDVSPGAEVDISSRYLSERDDELPTLALRNAVLLEMPVAVIPHAMGEILFRVSAKGRVPVLAHPERNELVQEDPDRAKVWLDAGAALQVDGDSLLGVWGSRSDRCARMLFERGWVHAMATDAHSCDRRPPRMQKALTAVTEIVGADTAAALVSSMPASLLDGNRPTTHPAPIQRPTTQRPSLISRLFRRN